MMDCRNKARRSLAVDILIYYRDLGYVHGKIRDIAPQGMCIDMHPVVLPDDTLVELAVTVPGDKGERFYRVEAFVAHAADGVVGLIFHKQDDANVRCLLRAIAEVANLAEPVEGARHDRSDQRAQVMGA
ncbi:MAG: hypothetical protein WC383_13190 [Gammaproteobacteria bacterium]